MPERKPRPPGLSPEERAKVFKALAEPSRVHIVDMLVKHGPLCGTELADKLGISLALLCHHWDVLIEAGIVHKERVGQARYCTLDLSGLHKATSDWGDPPSPAKKKAARRRGPTPRK
jgi:DNA-binding transcriptional ArsR family regulator